MSQSAARDWLFDKLVGFQLPDVSVYSYPPEAPSVPCLFLADDDPVFELGRIGAASGKMNLRLVCLSPMLDSDSANALLESLTDSLIQMLQAEGVALSVVGSTKVMSFGEGFDFYSREMPISLTVRND